jgi:dissimilatory sulfite reductase (desulfoviridin) alpha/beta subunit
VLNALDVCVDAILNEKKEKRFGELVRKIGIEEFKRRLKGNKDLSPEQVSDKRTVHSGINN